MVYWYQLESQEEESMPESIIKISDAAAIALHSMIILAQHRDKLLSVKTIASNLEISANHLSKVMQRLNKAGYIESIKGYNGGFKLTSDPENITFLEIVELFDGKFKSGSCLLTKKKCQGQCILGDLITSVNSQVQEKFRNTKISDFNK